jgi:hypothetical protein
VEKEPRVKATTRKKTYQIDRAFIRPHREAVNVRRLEIAGDGRPDPGGDLIVRQSHVGHPASLEIPGRDARPHFVHPQRPRHQGKDPPTMDGREDESGGQALQAQPLHNVEEGVEP